MEIWRPIPDWDGWYEVSDHGRVKSIDRTITTAEGKSWIVDGRYLLPWPLGSLGYPAVSLRNGTRRRNVTIHTLVLETFVGKRPPGLVACHGDSDPQNPRLTNLRWDTQASNLMDCLLAGRNPARAQVECKRSHEFSIENTYITRAGHRRCRQCERDRKRQARELCA